MEIIKRLFIAILILSAFSCEKEKPEIHKLKFKDDRSPYSFVNYYVIKNPPQDSTQVIRLVEQFVKLNNDFDLFQLNQVENFGLIFYKEGLTVDRNSGPNTVGRGVPFIMFWREKYYTDVMVVSISYDAKEFVRNKKNGKVPKIRSVEFGKGFR